MCHRVRVNKTRISSAYLIIRPLIWTDRANQSTVACIERILLNAGSLKIACLTYGYFYEKSVGATGIPRSADFLTEVRTAMRNAVLHGRSRQDGNLPARINCQLNSTKIRLVNLSVPEISNRRDDKPQHGFIRTIIRLWEHLTAWTIRVRCTSHEYEKKIKGKNTMRRTLLQPVDVASLCVIFRARRSKGQKKKNTTGITW